MFIISPFVYHDKSVPRPLIIDLLAVVESHTVFRTSNIKNPTTPKTNSTIKYFPCHCGKSFESLDTLENHILDNPPTPVVISKMTLSRSDDFICPCGLNFETTEALFQHTRDSLFDHRRPVRCHCDGIFEDQWDLYEHVFSSK